MSFLSDSIYLLPNRYFSWLTLPTLFHADGHLLTIHWNSTFRLFASETNFIVKANPFGSNPRELNFWDSNYLLFHTVLTQEVSKVFELQRQLHKKVLFSARNVQERLWHIKLEIVSSSLISPVNPAKHLLLGGEKVHSAEGKEESRRKLRQGGEEGCGRWSGPCHLRHTNSALVGGYGAVPMSLMALGQVREEMSQNCTR